MDRYGAIIYAAGLAFTAVAKTPPLLVYSVLFTSVGCICIPALIAFIANQAEPSERGALLGGVETLQASTAHSAHKHSTDYGTEHGGTQTQHGLRHRAHSTKNGTEHGTEHGGIKQSTEAQHLRRRGATDNLPHISPLTQEACLAIAYVTYGRVFAYAIGDDAPIKFAGAPFALASAILLVAFGLIKNTFAKFPAEAALYF